VLNAIYEVDFCGFSYGFRPGRKPHDALDALAVGIERKRVNRVLDADIRDFFGQLDHAWVEKFFEHRIADARVLRLIAKWLKAGVIEDGEWQAVDEGAPQGASVSPLIADVYLHYVLDRWARRWRSEQAHRDMIVLRWADDFVAGLEHRDDAERSCTPTRPGSSSSGAMPLALVPPRGSENRRRSGFSSSRTCAGRREPGASGSGGSRRRSGCGRSSRT